MADLSTLITEFMQGEYSITPSQKSLEIILNAGFKISKYPGEQFANLENVERRIRGTDRDTLVAKVFTLSFPYEYALGLTNEKAMHWAAWLGNAEYRLGRMANVELKDNLFNKALKHFFDSRQKGDGSKENASHIGNCYFRLGDYEKAWEYLLESRQKGNDSKENASLTGESYFRLRRYEEALPFFLEARQRGDGSKENASHIGDCYFRLERYEEALPFFLEARQKGDNSKENTSLIGNCYFRLGKYEECINEYERAIKLAKSEGFNVDWMRAVDYAMEDSFELLNRARETIQSPVYFNLLQRFQVLYKDFIDFWKANNPNTYFRLMIDGQGRPMDRIGNAIATVS